MRAAASRLLPSALPNRPPPGAGAGAPSTGAAVGSSFASAGAISAHVVRRGRGATYHSADRRAAPHFEGQGGRGRAETSDPRSARDAQGAGLSAAPAERPVRVLVVDDSESIRRFLTDWLVQHGY